MLRSLRLLRLVAVIGATSCLLGLAPSLRASEVIVPARSSADKPAAHSAETQEAPFDDPFADDESELAPTQKKSRVSDPIEPINRGMYVFNDRLYFWVLKPAGIGLKTVAPRPVRQHLSKFFLNTKFPIRFVNTLLQGRLKDTGIETSRFVVNSTIGLAGFFDPASRWNLKPQEADFDQTLGFYRIPTGPYIVWPILGPSSLRGTIGMAGDAACSPLTYIEGADWTMLSKPVEIVNTVSLRIGEYEAFKKANLDPYVSMRTTYVDYWAERDNKKKK